MPEWPRSQLIWPIGFIALATIVTPGAAHGEPLDEPATDSIFPRGVVDLPLEGFHPAVFVAPDRTVGSALSWPLTVVLHGNFDRPEWECEIWAKAARSRGWLLCPRGVPRQDVSPRLDRWTYRGRALIAREIVGGVAALERRFPGKVRRDDALLVGFSLGANIAPRLLAMKGLPFRGVVLAEGGLSVTADLARGAARRGVRRVVHLCGEQTICPARARTLLPFWRRAKVAARVLVMEGVGHGYPTDFDDLASRALAAVGP